MDLPRFAYRAVLAVLLLFTARAHASADIEVTIQASPVPVTIGSLITYDVVIRNHGPDVAQFVEVSFVEISGGPTVSDVPPVGWRSGCVCVHVFCNCSVWTNSFPVGGTAVWRIVQTARASPMDPAAVTFGVWLGSTPVDPTPTPEVRISTPIAGTSGVAVPALSPPLLALLVLLLGVLGVRAGTRRN